MKINWREKFVAVAIHFLATLAVAGIAAALIFLVWFPGALAQMVGGSKLFLIVVGCDLALGPLLSLVIYNKQKSRRELIIDYSVVALVQLAALIYGVLVVAASRPVFIGFYKDTIEIVTAIELDDADLAAGTMPEFRTKSWSGPRLMSVQSPSDPKEREQLIFSALAGKDGQAFPKYYRDYSSAKAGILLKSRPLDSLLEGSGASRASLESAIAAIGRRPESLRWLLVHHRFGFGIALIDAQTTLPVKYIAVDPTWVK